MNVATPGTPGPINRPSTAGTGNKIVQRKQDFETQADTYDISRNVGNKVSSAIIGLTGHVSGNAGLILPTVGETYKNLWKAETIGPYAKAVGSMVALAGIPMVVTGALVASPFMGLSEAFKQSDEVDYSPLVKDTTAEVADRITSKEDGPDTLLGKAIGQMREFGDKKLAPGEEPWDIPLNKIFKGALSGLNFLMVKVPVTTAKLMKKAAVEGAKATKKAAVSTGQFVKEYGPRLAGATLAGVTSTIIAGPAGLVIGAGVGMALAGRDIKNAFTDKDRSIGSRVGGVAKTLAYIPVGPVMAGISVKENFSRSFSEGWNGRPVEAIKTTGKAVIANAKEALNPTKGDGHANPNQ